MFPDLNRTFQQLPADRAPAAAQGAGNAGSASHRPQSQAARAQATTDGALAQLKALGPRLTLAQRKSIDLLENFQELRDNARTMRNTVARIDDHERGRPSLHAVDRRHWRVA